MMSFLPVYLHFVGDYVVQTDKMATMKTSSWKWTSIHAMSYSCLFLFVTHSAMALAVIFSTHLLIDRFRLVRYLIFVKNKITDWSMKWSDCSATGFHKDTPPWMSVWLMIIIDNIIHIGINSASLRFLG